MIDAETSAPRRGSGVAVLLLGLAALAVLVTLGTWQVQRLQWKENLLATIEERISSEPRSLAEIEAELAAAGEAEYWPVTVEGVFRHEGERHFFTTHRGASGYAVITPLELADGRFVLVNRGFVPFESKDPATRPEGQVESPVAVTGLARDPLFEKPSFVVPDNDLEKNVFYWKDFAALAGSSEVGSPDRYVPLLVDADAAPDPGGLPLGGITIVDLPNNHLQYAVTWYGLAAALLAVLAAWFWRRRRDT